MTAKRDLKRRVRERQARTGESYMTALRQVRGQQAPDAPVPAVPVPAVPVPAVSVIEMIDVTDIAAALGIQCTATLSPTLADRIDVATVLRQLRDALTATARDPAFAVMRAAVMRGENPAHRPTTAESGRRFMVRASAGIGGISEHGTILALATRGRQGVEMVVFALRLLPARSTQRPPALLITSPDGLIVAGNLSLAWR
jgi:hypothetical protein